MDGEHAEEATVVREVRSTPTLLPGLLVLLTSRFRQLAVGEKGLVG